MRRTRISILALALLATFPFMVMAQAPDMTTTNLTLIKDVYGNPFNRNASYNLGPTGLRGWIYFWGDGKRAWSPGIDGSMTDVKPYQVLVVAIGTNTPASGVLQIDDVLLGVNTGSNNIPVPLFTNDTRRAIGTAIGAAEAGDGWMNFKIFRGGATNDVSIRLNISGMAYSATAPYDCTKSSLILSNAVARLGTINLMAVDYSRCQSLDALALLASGNTNYLPRIQEFARSIRTGPVEGGTWGYAYNGIFLSEYYLKTGDTNVLPVLSGLMKLCALTDRYGTICHGPGAIPPEMFGKPLEDAYLDDLMNNGVGGEPGGVSGGYGPVNQVAVSANLAMVMGKKCLLQAGWSMHPAVEAAITRGKNFFGWHVQKGEIQYGEHNPMGSASHGDNGKHAQAAVFSSMLGDQPAATEYWTRMTLAGYLAREYGHTGQGFSYLWTGLGANMGGTNAMAAYVSAIRWHLDLSRRSDGSFTYDGAEQFGPSLAADYWTSTKYWMDSTTSYILTYATPLKQVYLTGRDLPAANVLSADKVANAIGSAMALTNVFLMTTNQLVDALDEYDPDVRLWAAQELGRRPGVDMASITNLLGSTNAWLRASACQVLGTLKDTNSLPALGQCLSDPDITVRGHAGLALKKFNALASPLIPTMLQAYVANAHDPYGIDWEDPWECANGILAEVLFGGWIMTMTQGHDGLVPETAKADRNLLYPVIRLALKHPDTLPRGAAAGFVNSRLNVMDIQALVLDLTECATTSVLADPMWRSEGRVGAIRALGKFHSPEAVPVALAMQSPWWWAAGTLDCAESGSPSAALDVLATYGDSVRWLLPTLNNYVGEWGPRDGRYTSLVNAINAISAAVTAPVLTNLFPVARSQVVALTNATAITLTGYSCRTNAVTFQSFTSPSHGSLSGTAPYLTYTPDGGYSGVDSFTFQVADQMTNSAPGTVSIIVGTAGAGIQGQYYDNMDFTSQKVTRVDSQVNFDWGTGAPTNTMGSDSFSVQWSGQLLVPETGTYMFSTLNSDGARLYVNGQRMIDDWTDHDRVWNDGASIELTAGQQANVWLEYYENTGNATAKLKWSGPSFGGSNGVIVGSQWLGAQLLGATVTNMPVYAFSQNVSLVQNTSQLIILAGTYTNFILASTPSNGSLSGTPPRVTYTPNPNYVGLDSFTFRVTDGVTTSAAATVAVSILTGSPETYTWKTAVSGDWSEAAKWTTGIAPGAAGQPYYGLAFTPSGTYSATNNLNADFALNRMSFAGTVTLAGNSICTTNNGPILPEISQNSASAVTLNVPLTLGATTTLGGLAGGSVTLNGLISGPGGLVINSHGNVNLMYATNTYSGGTIVNYGVVWCTGGETVKMFGSGPVTFNPSTRFQHNRNILTNSVTLNGATLAGGNSFATTLSGPVTLQGVSTIDGNGSGNLVISGNISGSGGLITKPGAFQLYGTNTYTGSTTVENGNLLYWKAVSVAPGALNILGSSRVYLNYTGDQRITTLTLEGIEQPDGTYGSTASPATFKNDTYFSGTGTVTSGTDQQTITFNALPAKTYGDAPFALNATASSGLTVTYTSSDPSVASVSSNVVTILKAGTTEITANQAGNILYFPAPPVVQTQTVNKANQTITFGALPAKVYGDAPFSLTATASSGLTVSYASSNTTVATVSGDLVTILKAGTTTLVASQAGNVNYNAASVVPQALSVAPRPVVLGSSRIYDATTALDAADLSVANKVGGDSVSLTGTATLSGKDAGSQTVLAAGYATPARIQSATNSTGDAAATSVVVTLGATPANSNTLVAVISTRGTSSDRVTGISGGGVTWSRASQAANANGTTTEIWYGPNVSGGTTAITITQASLRSAAVVMEYSGILAANPLDQVANATGASTSAATGTTPATTQARELWIGGIGLSGSAYTLGAALNGFASITNVQTGSATASDNAKVYALEAITNVTGLAASGGSISGTQTATIALRASTTASTAAGSLDLVVPSGVQVGDLLLANIANYHGTSASISAPGTWTATSAAGTLTVATMRGALFYRVATSADTSAPTYSFTVATGGTLPGAAGAIVAFSGVDTTTPFDVAPGALSTGTGAAASATAITTLSANAAVVMFGMHARTGSGAAARTWSLQSTGTPGSLTLTELYDAAQAGNNFHPSVMAAWATKAVAGNTGTGVATLSNTAVNYGLVLCALKPATLPVQWSGAIATFKAATADLLSLGGADAANYTLSGMSGTVTVAPKALTLDGASAANKIYDATTNVTITGGGLLTSEAPGAGTTADGKPYMGDTVGVTLSGAFDTKDAGAGKSVSSTSTLTGAQAGNYTLTQPVGLTATITAKALNLINEVVASKPYDGTTNATFSAGELKTPEAPGTGTTSDNTPYTGDAVGVSLAGFFASKNAAAGIAVTSVSTLTGAQAGNYTLTLTPGLTGDITARALTVTASNQSKFWDQALTFGSGSTLFTSSGLQAGETIGTVTLACTGGAAGAAVGSYTITPSAATGGTFTPANYAITYADGTLTVNSAGQAITFGALLNKTYGDAPFSLTGSASSGLPVSYESSDTNIATIAGATVTILNAGVTTITASQAGNASWAAATSVPQTLTVNQATQTISFVALPAKTYGDAPFSLTATASSGLLVSYSSSDTNVAIVVSNLVTVLNVGTSTITATQAGDANWAAATSVSQALLVNQATQLITFAALPAKTYGATPFSLTASAGSGLPVSYSSSDTNVATVAGSTVTVRNAGSTTITATQAGNTNWVAATPVPQALLVNKAMPVITWSAPATITTGTPLSSNQLNATSGGVAGSFVYTPPADTVLPVGEGHVLRVSFTPTDTDNYSTPTDLEVFLTVSAVFLAEDFEHEWADNDLARKTNNWSSIGVWDQSSITNPAVGYGKLPRGVLFPLIYNHTTSRRILSVKGQGDILVTPPINAGYATERVYADMMVQFVAMSEPQTHMLSANTAKAKIFLLKSATATNLVVLHGQKSADGFGVPLLTPVAEGIEPGAWHRLTVTFDATTNSTGAEAFSVQINGEPLISTFAYSDTWKTKIFSENYQPDGGSWFLTASRRLGYSDPDPTRLANMQFTGRAFVDDLVVTVVPPKFDPGTLILLALSTGSGGEELMGFDEARF